MVFKLDEIDEKILNYLKFNSKATVREVSKKTLIPISTVHSRLKKLNNNVIKNYTINVNYDVIGKDILVYVLVNIDVSVNQKLIQTELLKKSYVERADIITGDHDLLLLIRCENIKELNEIILKELHVVKGIVKTKAMLVIDEGKN